MIKIRFFKILLVFLIILGVLTLVAAFFSYMKLEVANPLSSGLALAKIFFTDTDYVEIQESPRVIVAQPENSLELLLQKMQSEGYTHIEEETLGSLHVFEKDGQRERLFFSVNKYFSKWIWEN